MGFKQIRIGQLIAPFGPGSLYTDARGTPLVVCGLDHWFKKWDPVRGLIQCDEQKEFAKFETRLSALLHVDRFFSPPDYRHIRKGAQPPPNASLNIPAQRFPCWYRHTRTGEMHRFSLHTTVTGSAPGGGRWQPVRFVSVCAGGHLCEFPWQEWIGCKCPGGGSLFLTDRGGSELSSVTVKCRTCPEGSTGRRGRSLSGTTMKPDSEQGEQSAFQRSGIACPGERPWLGEGANEANCPHPLIGALINQTNLYFAKTISAISLPVSQVQSEEIANIRAEIERDQGTCGLAKVIWRSGDRRGTVAFVESNLKSRGIVSESPQVEEALISLLDPAVEALPAGSALPSNPEPELLSFRRAEFNIIRNEVNDPIHVPNLRVISAKIPGSLTQWLARVNLVERLRETRVFYGFDRLEQNTNPLAGVPDTAMQQLFRNPPAQPHDRWLPAVEVFGEGIYLELSEDCITKWQTDNASWLENRLNEGFVMRLGGVFHTLPPLGPANRNWASRYLLIHSLSHIFINQLVFECGYSTAALRERLYISADPTAPMASMLIYTAAGDSEGTLGGLVRLGHPERLGSVLRRGLSRASWCSADPVCSENLGGQGSRLANLGACHACILLPETSCETINQGLDRAMVVGMPDDRKRGLMANLLEEAYVLE